uniref:Uncharacterized protein SEN0022 n=1 Tax=Synechococcus elongatus (strain ATCC 33912 / PCC 7942 / FACHB-805) TaxID=1140 RepID=Q8GJL8_SYNE7|nr:unknown protein [Synechococcus elongatus PCC 7942 = FACHB-805]
MASKRIWLSLAAVLGLGLWPQAAQAECECCDWQLGRVITAYSDESVSLFRVLTAVLLLVCDLSQAAPQSLDSGAVVSVLSRVLNQVDGYEYFQVAPVVFEGAVGSAGLRTDLARSGWLRGDRLRQLDCKIANAGWAWGPTKALQIVTLRNQLLGLAPDDAAALLEASGYQRRQVVAGTEGRQELWQRINPEVSPLLTIRGSQVTAVQFY